MDFGLAKDTQQESGLSRTGQALGTPAYMAPEQAEGKANLVGPRSDVYSLGAILYEMLAGRPPFVGENALQVMRAALHEEPVPPRVFTPGVPRDLETICLKCLEKEPARRYGSAAEFADDLKAFQHDEPISARPTSAVERVWKKVRKNPAPYVVGSVALLVIIVGTALFMWSLNQKRLEAEASLARFLTEKEAKETAERQRLALETEKKRAWQLVFEDDFSDPARSKSNWGGEGPTKWQVRDGELRAERSYWYYLTPRMPIAGDIRIEFDCRVESELLSDVSCFLAALPKEGPFSGYIFKYGGWSNTRHSLERARAGAEMWSQSATKPIIRGMRYHACAERVGKRLTYTVNGQIVFSVEDEHPLTGNDRSMLGLYSYGTSTVWDNVRVYRLGEPLAADLLEIAERHLERGSLVAASELFTEVLASSNDASRRDSAKIGLDKSMRALAFQERLPELRNRILQVWPKAQVKIGRDGIIVSVADAGLTNLTPLQGLPVTELYCTHNKVSDLTPLKGMPLAVLHCSGNQINSLEPLRGLPLVELFCVDNHISTLEPLRDMKLSKLDCNGNPIASLEPLRGMPIDNLGCPSCQIKSLEPLCGMPLHLLNCNANDIESLEPLRGMKLTVLNCGGNKITSLDPLAGMPLINLTCFHNQLTEIEALRGMPLTFLQCQENQIASLDPLRGAPLSDLICRDNQIVSLAALRGAPMHGLHCGNNRLTSLDPYQEWPPENGFFFACDTLPDAELERVIAEWTKPRLPEEQPKGRSTTALFRARRNAALQAKTLLAVRKGNAELLKSLARPFKSHRYLIIHLGLTWPEAQSLCERLGGHLATLNSRAEEQAVDPLLDWGWAEAWIGLSRTRISRAEPPNDGTDSFNDAWATGETITYTHYEKNTTRDKSGHYIMTKDHAEGNPWCLVPEAVPPARNFFIIEWDE
ncbi:MAG: protein kinase [Planctomycetota bacterium]|nr:protein kinase [Planctomycetota bacterium]